MSDARRATAVPSSRHPLVGGQAEAAPMRFRSTGACQLVSDRRAICIQRARLLCDLVDATKVKP